jgi:hypothetical protein
VLGDFTHLPNEMLAPNDAGGSHSLPSARRAPLLGEQNMNMNKQMIREQAYELWDHAGRPDGRSDEFWFAARAEFEREEETGEGNLGAHVPPHVDPSRHEH